MFSIAFAAIGATVFVGILVNGNYDNIEQSFFESQDDELQREGERASSSPSKQAAIDFFGDVNPTPAAPPPPAARAEHEELPVPGGGGADEAGAGEDEFKLPELELPKIELPKLPKLPNPFG